MKTERRSDTTGDAMKKHGWLHYEDLRNHLIISFQVTLLP